MPEPPKKRQVSRTLSSKTSMLHQLNTPHDPTKHAQPNVIGTGNPFLTPTLIPKQTAINANTDSTPALYFIPALSSSTTGDEEDLPENIRQAYKLFKQHEAYAKQEVQAGRVGEYMRHVAKQTRPVPTATEQEEVRKRIADIAAHARQARQKAAMTSESVKGSGEDTVMDGMGEAEMEVHGLKTANDYDASRDPRRRR